MANETELVVKIRADSKEGIADLNKLQIQIKELDLELKKNKGTAEEIAAVNAKVANSYKEVQESLDRMTGGTLKYVNVSHQLFHAQNRQAVGFNSMATSIVDMQKASQQSRTALLSVSQAIQDAPYGIRGMSNNIDFLAQQFLVLRANAGSTGNALGLMFKNLGSASGVLIAFSAVSAAINYFTNLKNSSDEATVSIENFNDAYIKALTSGLGDVAVMGAATLKAKYERENKDAELRNKEILKKAKVVVGGGMGSYGMGKALTELQEKEIANNNQIVVDNKAKLVVVNNILIASIAQRQVERDLLGLGKSDKKLKEDRIKADKEWSDAWDKRQQDEDESDKHLAKIEEDRLKAINERLDLDLLDLEIKRETTNLSTQDYIIGLQTAALYAQQNGLKGEYLQIIKKLSSIEKEKYNELQSEIDQRYISKELTNQQYIFELKKLLVIAEQNGLLNEARRIRMKIAQVAQKDDLGDLFKKGIKDSVLNGFDQMINKISFMNDKFNMAGISFKAFSEIMLTELSRIILKMIAMAAVEAIITILNPIGAAAKMGGTAVSGSTATSFAASGGYINEHIYGVGKSGRRYEFGEKGSELIIPNNRLANNMNSSRGAGGGAMNVVVTGKLKGRDIYLSNVRESHQISRLSY